MKNIVTLPAGNTSIAIEEEIGRMVAEAKLPSQTRTLKALCACTGSKEELLEFETQLKGLGLTGVMSNESSRLLELKWIVVYADFAEAGKDCNLTYAYRTTNCKHTSKPNVISRPRAIRRLQSGYYVENNILKSKFRR